jgi:hypothetical protein
MPSLAILSTTGSSGTWWSWHLAWALAEQGLDVIWVEAEGAEWTPKLLNPFQKDDWEAERLPSLLHVARGDEGVPPLALPDLEAVPTLRILPGWPTHRPGRLEAEQIDAHLARWIRAQDAWVVVSLSRPWLNPWTQVLQESRATITVASPNRESVRDLRALGRALEGRLPEHRRYAFIDQPEDRYKRKGGGGGGSGGGGGLLAPPGAGRLPLWLARHRRCERCHPHQRHPLVCGHLSLPTPRCATCRCRSSACRWPPLATG